MKAAFITFAVIALIGFTSLLVFLIADGHHYIAAVTLGCMGVVGAFITALWEVLPSGMPNPVVAFSSEFPTRQVRK